MAGLVAAARSRELGTAATVREKGDRPGGSMLVSSCVVWRYRTVEDFRRECPGGDQGLQRVVVERLDDALAWLESLGAPVVARDTGNPRTVGARFDPGGLTDVLVRAAGEVQLGTPLAPEDDVPLVLATGGFQGDPRLVARYIAPAAELGLRANSWSAGDGLKHGLARGAALSAGMGEFYGRNMPDAEIAEDDFVLAAQLYARHALVLNVRGEEFLEQPVSWSEVEVVQATARQPGATAWYAVAGHALEERVRGRTVREMAETAERLGGTVVPASSLPFPVPEDSELAVRVRPGITHTIGGLRVDERARVLAEDGRALEGLWACGADAGGIAAGGYASGLACALVLGLAAAEDYAA